MGQAGRRASLRENGVRTKKEEKASVMLRQVKAANLLEKEGMVKEKFPLEQISDGCNSNLRLFLWST